MRQMRDIMGMPVIVDIVGGGMADCDHVFSFFDAIDRRFSTYRADSEMNCINRGEISREGASAPMREILALCEREKTRFAGYFDIKKPDGSLDPSGLVKGWAIREAAALTMRAGFSSFWIEAGGDIQTAGTDEAGKPWSVGIRNPFDMGTIVEVIYPQGRGVATSGTYIRGEHIYDPHTNRPVETPFISLTVVAPDIYEADMYATAGFAMGEKGIAYLERASGIEAYAIDHAGIATMTSGWKALRFV